MTLHISIIIGFFPLHIERKIVLSSIHMCMLNFMIQTYFRSKITHIWMNNIMILAISGREPLRSQASSLGLRQIVYVTLNTTYNGLVRRV